MLIDDHEETDKGKIKGQLVLEHISGFCKTFKKIIIISVSLLHSNLLIYKLLYIQK